MDKLKKYLNDYNLKYEFDDSDDILYIFYDAKYDLKKLEMIKCYIEEYMKKTMYIVEYIEK